jgi:enoyl-CoA hydratase/carnithine racemase
LIGAPRALQMFLLAEMVEADEALRIGLVNKLSQDPVGCAVDAINSSQWGRK